MATNHTIAVTAIAVPVLVIAHAVWVSRVQQAISSPYLDEFFHIPQADAFWQGNWSHWDDKITTPPGVYLWSIVCSKVFWVDTEQSKHLSPRQARVTNNFVPYILVLCAFLLERQSTRRGASKNFLSTRQLSVFTFPLIFFFSGLYYTDVFSALTVLATYAFWNSSVPSERGLKKFSLQAMVLVCGLISLASRQTNIFWVAVFMGGLQAVHTVVHTQAIHDPSLLTNFEGTSSSIVAPENLELMLESDYRNLPIFWILSAFRAIPELVLDLWPHVCLLASFAGFVIWNGGVVLGDKSNHMATIHLPQMLYIWPFILFFSWPVLLPVLSRPDWLLRQAPRPALIVLALVAITGIVHYNTIVHPFLLADNRHYTFYVFKILRQYPWLLYALVPVYAVSAWLSIVALAGMDEDWAVTPDRRKKTKSQEEADMIDRSQNSGTRLSFLLIWLLSTALSLITAPLVEPRYFLVPWLLWRLQVPFPDDTPAKRSTGIQSVVAKYAVWMEISWYMLINLATCGLFLGREFRWAHVPDDVQRFMW